MYLGMVQLEQTLDSAILLVDNNGTPINAAGWPHYRVYGPNGLVATGTLTAWKDDGVVTGASNASPIAITSVGHGLTTGTVVTVSGVTGNAAANGTWVVTVIDADTFSLDGSTGDGAYAGGGKWHVTGLYDIDLEAKAGYGYDAGVNYIMTVDFQTGDYPIAEQYTFTVV